MNYLHFVAYPVTPHIETDLEILYQNMKTNPNIKVCICRRAMYMCFNNPTHKNSICTLCIGRILNGLKLIKFPKENIIFIEKRDRLTYKEYNFNDVNELINFEYDGQLLGRSAASSLIDILNKDFNFDTIKYKDMVNASLNTSIFLYIYLKELIIKERIEKVIMFNGRITEFNVCVNVCKKLGIPFTVHERAGTIKKYILIENSVPQDYKIAHDIEKIWNRSNDPNKYRIAEQLYIERRNGKDQSWYSFTKHQKRDMLPSNFDRTKKNIAFFDSTIQEFFIFKEQIVRIYRDFFEAIEKICKDLLQDEHYHIYFRVHPNLKNTNNTQIQKYKEIAKKYKNITLIEPESLIDSYYLMDNCEKLVVFSSTIGIEAIYWGKPCILLFNTYYSHLNGNYIPKTHEEVIQLIRSDLKPKDKLLALMYSYWELSRGIEFELFEADDLGTGKFLGKKLGYPISSLVIYTIQKYLKT